MGRVDKGRFVQGGPDGAVGVSGAAVDPSMFAIVYKSVSIIARLL
jgi:hypothetical protein